MKENKKFHLIYITLMVLSLFVFCYEFFNIKTITIDNYIDDSYGYTTYDANGNPTNPGETERRLANVPWYAFPLQDLSGYCLIVLLFLIPAATVFTIIRWKIIRRLLIVYIPLLAFAIFTVIYWFRDF